LAFLASFSTNKIIFGGEINDFSAVFTAILAFFHASTAVLFLRLGPSGRL